MHPAVSLRNVVKSYDEPKRPSRRVLTGATMDIAQGECVFIVGPSGSGKTTLLSIVGCLLRHDLGDVYILGQNVNRLSDKETAKLRRNQIGFLFQKFNLIRGLSVWENVALPLRFQKINENESRRRAMELLNSFGMASFANGDPRRMSGGQCQRVALARALIVRPQLILVDEPTASVDADNGQAIMKHILDLTRQSQCAAIVVTHDPRILDFADRVLAVEDGTVQTTQNYS